MSAFDNLISAGIASMQAQCPSTVVCNGVTRTGTAGASNIGVTADTTGQMTQLDGMVVLRLADFTALGIGVDKKFTLDGELVRCVTIATDGPNPVDVHYKKAR